MTDSPNIQDFIKSLAESAQAQAALITRIGHAIEQIAESQHAQHVLLAALFEAHPEREHVLSVVRQHVETQADPAALKAQLESLIGPIDPQ